MHESRQRHLVAGGGRLDVDLAQGIHRALQFRQDLQNDVVAVHLREILRDLTLALSAEALLLAGQDDALTRATDALDSGRAAEIFARMVVAQGGPADLTEAPQKHLAAAPVIRPIPAPASAAAPGVDRPASIPQAPSISFAGDLRLTATMPRDTSACQNSG